MCPRVAAEIAWLISAAALAGSAPKGACATPALYPVAAAFRYERSVVRVGSAHTWSLAARVTPGPSRRPSAFVRACSSASSAAREVPAGRSSTRAIALAVAPRAPR